MEREEKSIWVKFGSIFAIIIMVGSATIGVMMLTGWGSDKTKAYPFSDVPGTHVNFTFTNIKDGVKYLPDGASQISCFTTNASINASMSASFPGFEASKVLVAYYPTGALEYYQIKTERNVSIMINGSKPTYENYDNYNIIRISPVQRVIVGSPIIIASLSNYANDSNLARRAVDVLTGFSGGSKDFDPILAYADNVSDFTEMVVSKSTGSGYSMLYQRSGVLANGTIQLETIVYGPSSKVRTDLNEMAAGDSATFRVSEDGSMIKLYIESNDQVSYALAANNLYAVINQLG